MIRRTALFRFKIVLLMLCICTAFVFRSFAVHAEEYQGKVVRVGWYESTFCKTDENGRNQGMPMSISRRLPLIRAGNMSMLRAAGLS
jgi:hypothetical protein